MTSWWRFDELIFCVSWGLHTLENWKKPWISFWNSGPWKTHEFCQKWVKVPGIWFQNLEKFLSWEFHDKNMDLNFSWKFCHSLLSHFCHFTLEIGHFTLEKTWKKPWISFGAKCKYHGHLRPSIWDYAGYKLKYDIFEHQLSGLIWMMLGRKKLTARTVLYFRAYCVILRNF